jgi:hypothetical protein
MTSPDFRPYVDLTIFDKQPRDMYQEALDYAALAFPDLAIRPGTLEDALFQAMSYVSGEVIASINRLPNGLMEGILNLLGFARIQSTFATGTVQFIMIDDAGASIPAGTQVGYTESVEGLSTFHTFTTTTATTVPEGETISSPVNIVADAAGEKPSLLSGQTMVVVSASNRILSAALASDLTSGEAAENNTEYFSRGATYLGSLSSALATATQMQNYVLSNHVEVHRCRVYDLTELVTITPTLLDRDSDVVTATVPSGHGIEADDMIRVYGALPTTFNGIHTIVTASGTELTWSQEAGNASTTTHGSIERLDSLNASAAAEAPGAVVIFVAGENGASITGEKKAEILTEIEERATAGLDISVADAILVGISCEVTVKSRPSFSAVAVSLDVSAFLEELLSPNGWPWEERIRASQIIARVSQLTGVDYVSDVVFAIEEGYEDLAVVEPNGDVSFIFKGSLPVAGITVSEEV